MKTEIERKTYNGWANYETWNVALFINNDPLAYRRAVKFVQNYKGRSPFQDFVDSYGYLSTFDGVLLNDPKISRRELNSMMRDLES
jgi:hypothetical protein